MSANTALAWGWGDCPHSNKNQDKQEVSIEEEKKTSITKKK